MDSSSANVDIKKKQQQAPTPQNTPIFSAPINSSVRPSVPTVEEDIETIQTPGTSLLANNPALMSMLQGRLGNLVGAPSGYVQTLSPEVRRRVNGLKSLQNKHAVLEAEFQNEILALEKKYLALYTPLYEKRADFVSGKTEPTDAEVEDGVSEDEDEDEEDEEEEDDKDAEKVEGIPEFWLTALKSHPQFADIITEKDEEALKHLVDIRMAYFDKPGFRLEFEFSPNEFFTNTLLTKTYYYQDEPGYGGDFVYDHAEGTKIEWKEGKDMSVTVETKKQRHKGTNKTRVVKKTVPAETFFSFFTPPVAPEDDDEDVEEDEDIDEKLEADYGLGEELKDSVIPRAVDWFTGKALQYQDGGDQYDDDFEYDDEDDEEDDDEEDDEDDDDEDVPAKDEKAPECKQQ
ncbi:nucleosome assembly protein 1-like 1 [Podila verticillata NRRL 6337]|nr:nucleosome assembly protein 1-like 1 [Podila verticillata NRRL 6337]